MAKKFKSDDVTEFARSSEPGFFISSNAPSDGVFVKVGEIDTSKTDQDWSEELSDLQRDAERYRWLVQQVGKVKLHTGTFGGCAKMLDIGQELSEYIDFRIDSYLSGEDW